MTADDIGVTTPPSNRPTIEDMSAMLRLCSALHATPRPLRNTTLLTGLLDLLDAGAIALWLSETSTHAKPNPRGETKPVASVVWTLAEQQSRTRNAADLLHDCVPHDPPSSPKSSVSSSQISSKFSPPSSSHAASRTSSHASPDALSPASTPGSSPGSSAQKLSSQFSHDGNWSAIIVVRADGVFDARHAVVLRLVHDACVDLIHRPVLRSVDHSLSPRGRQVLELLLTGMGEKDIARALGRSRHTVHSHIKQIYRQFNVNSRPELMTQLLQR